MRDVKGTGKRQRQTQETRHALMDAGITAFAAKGHDGVNLAKDILEPEGISVGSFYHQFANKTELLLAILERATTRGRALIERAHTERVEQPFEQLVSESWDTYLSLVDVAEDLVRIQLRERHSPNPEIAAAVDDLYAMWVSGMALRYEQGVGPDLRIDAASVAEVTAALAVGAITTYLHTPPDLRPETKASLVEKLSKYSIYGVAGFISGAPDEPGESE